jgi:hypothetical protein
LSDSLVSLRGRLGAYEKWSRCADPSAATAPAREAFLTRFERAVDPDGTLDPRERARRAEYQKRAYFTRLALKSAEARRRKAAS